MTQKQRIDAFAALGAYLSNLSTATSEPFLERVAAANPWYTVPNVKKQFQSLSTNLTPEALEEWLAPYPEEKTEKTVALVLAGNIPLVGFHDILSALILGFNAQIKLSSDDAGLTKFVLDELIAFEESFRSKISFVDRIHDYDVVIATGSNNSARYFEHYFGEKPHIIRRNRNSIAVLSGDESPEKLQMLGHDILDFFGLGCRSISKIYVPKGYEFTTFFEAIEGFKDIREHFKYQNNYDYNKSIYLINGDTHLDNGFLLVKEDPRLASPLATVHVEYYDNGKSVEQNITQQQEAIQCIVTEMDFSVAVPAFAFGQSQTPSLTDYADHINTLDFLVENR